MIVLFRLCFRNELWARHTFTQLQNHPSMHKCTEKKTLTLIQLDVSFVGAVVKVWLIYSLWRWFLLFPLPPFFVLWVRDEGAEGRRLKQFFYRPCGGMGGVLRGQSFHWMLSLLHYLWPCVLPLSVCVHSSLQPTATQNTPPCVCVCVWCVCVCVCVCVEADQDKCMCLLCEQMCCCKCAHSCVCILWLGCLWCDLQTIISLLELLHALLYLFFLFFSFRTLFATPKI